METIQAYQADGTGLAYRMEDGGYYLLHVPTGKKMFNLSLPTASEAQAFLETVAILDQDQWSITEQQFKERYYRTGRLQEMQQKIKDAYFSARKTVTQAICEACGKAFETEDGYYEPGAYAYCSDCCYW